jgi:hypothetical protein
MPCLALRSTDTVETLAKTQQRYQSLAAGDPDRANVIHTCANLQKKATGLSGLMCEVQGTSLLNAVDTLTEEAFRGVSVVKCNIDDVQALSVLQRKTELGETLRGLMHDMQEARKNQAGMLLDQIMPTDAAQDFWWLGQTCEYKGGSTTKESILHDGKRGDVVFYDAFTCIARSENAPNTHEAGSDCSFRDACVWEPNLHGSIGIYTQGAGDGNNLFLVCISDFDQIASDIVLSMKADLGSSISAADFCSSKEMWFLEHIALRNRLRLILRVAQHLGIKVPQKMDMYAHPQQQNADLAVECCGVNLDHIECQIHADARAHQAVSVVRHYKDCVDVTHRKGPIPVFLGHEQGFLLLLPERANHASFAIYNDTTAYVQDKTGECVHLCPTHNINEQNRLNLQKIRAEQQSIVHITISDLLYDCHLQGRHVPQHTRELLTSTDEHGCFLFYGVQYGANTPRVIYPNVLPAFLRASNAAPGVVHSATVEPTPLTPSLPPPLGSDIVSATTSHVDATTVACTDEALADVSQPARPQPQQHQSQPPPASTPSAVAATTTLSSSTAVGDAYVLGGGAATRNHQNLAETMCSVYNYTLPDSVDGSASGTTTLFDFHTQQGTDDPSRMSMEWGDVTISLLKRMTRMHQIDTIALVPHATFSNAIPS